MASSKKVFWSETERIRIVARAIEIREGKLPESPLHLFREAMKALAADRRRQVRTLADVPWFMDMMEAALKERKKARETHSDPAMPVFKHVPLAQRLFWTELLTELREQTTMLRKLTDKNGSNSPTRDQ